MKRVVITGVGVVSPVGNNAEIFWNSIKTGQSGVDLVTRFNTDDMTCKVAAEVKDFSTDGYIEKKEAKRMDLFTQYGVVAAKMALEDSKLDIKNGDPERVGVIIGSGIGGISTLEDQHKVLMEKGPRRVSPFFIPMLISNILPAQIAIMTGAKGYNQTVVSACASSTNAIGDAFRLLQRGDLDIVISGGAEAAITPLSFSGFCSMKAMSTRNSNPKMASCPFDADRDGFIMGEGAGVVILEELEHAKSRGANILAEICGYGVSNDAYHITAPAPDGIGAAKAMELAIKDAGIQPNEVEYINAHGTSTPYNDKFETNAIKQIFGEHAYTLAVSSTKSMTGHLLGAAGGIEAIITSLALTEGFLPPTINYVTPDPDCDLDYIINQGREKEINYALSNSFGFGGHNATILLKKYRM